MQPNRRTPVLTMCIGLPASGKSQWARAQVLAHAYTKRVNKDDLRALLDAGVWTREKEKFILQCRDTLIAMSLAAGYDVISDDTNLAPVHKSRLEQLAAGAKAQFATRSFLDVPVGECLRRDAMRAASVGEKVILDMYKKYVLPAQVKPVPPVFNPALPDVVLCDVDGTITLGPHMRGPFEWDKVGQDLPRKLVCNMLKQLNCRVLFVSGRDESCRVETHKWIKANTDNIYMEGLIMRPAGDQRKDSIVKREIYEKDIAPRYNVMAVFDDRQQVVDMWRSLGLTCLQVAEGAF